MLESNLKAVNNDVNTLVKDSQELLHAATALTGEKADEALDRAIRMLDAALVKGREMQASALACGKDLAVSADGYVKENPWRSIAAMAGLGLLAGALLGRK